MKYFANIIILIVLFTTIISAQDKNVGIGTTTPNASALLDLTATDKGLLIPRMTTTQRDAIVSPSLGLLIYNTTDNKFQFYYGGWVNSILTNAVTSLNGLTGATQTFSTGNTGTDFTISSTGTAHTFNVPDASTANRGLVTTGVQTLAGAKTLTGTLTFLGTATDIITGTNENLAIMPNGTGNVGIGTTTPVQKLTIDGTLGIIETGTSPTYHSIFQGGDQGADITYTLPTAVGANGQVLTTDATGVLSWATPSIATAWNITGNSLTDPATNFLGTTDDKALIFKVNSQKAGEISSGDNTAFGYQAFNVNTTGTQNSAFGFKALSQNRAGTSNTGIGFQALYSNTTVGAVSGKDNVAVGWQALFANTTGSNNTAIGQLAGRYIADGATANETSSTSVYLGSKTKASADPVTNEIVIGYDATGSGSNTITLGNTSIVTSVMRGDVTLTNSDNIANEIRFQEPSASGTNFVAFKAPILAADNTYTLPDAYPTSNGQVLSATTAGILSWSAGGGSVTGTGTVDYLARWTPNTTTLGTSLIRDNGTTVSVNTALDATYRFKVTGTSMTAITGQYDANIFGSLGTSLSGNFYGVYGQYDANHYGTLGFSSYGVGSFNTSTAAGIQRSLYAQINGSGSGDRQAVYANASGASGGGNSNYGVYSQTGGGVRNFGYYSTVNGTAGSSTNYGIQAIANTGLTSYGVWGEASDVNTATNYGVYGLASGANVTGTRYGVYGEASGGLTNWAGYFAGDVKTTGKLYILETGTTPTRHTIFQGGDQTGDIIYTLPTAQGAASTYLQNDGTGVLTWAAAGSGSATLSSLTSATGTNTLNNANWAQIWNWPTATTEIPMLLTANGITTGSILNITSSYGSGNSTNGLLYVANTGAGTSGIVFRAQSNSTAGTGLTVLASGNVGIGTVAPSQKLAVEGTFGILEGGTSPTWHTIFQGGDQTGANITYTLPPAQGAASTYLQNDGTGVLTWAAAGSGSATLSSLTSATGTNTLNNANWAQIWNWPTATTEIPMLLTANTLTTGTILDITSSTGNGSTNGLLRVANTGGSSTGIVFRAQSNSTANSGLTVNAAGTVSINDVPNSSSRLLSTGTSMTAITGSYDGNVLGSLGTRISPTVFYGAYGQWTATRFGYLGSTVYGAYGQFDGNHYGYLGAGTAGVFGVNNGTAANEYGVQGSVTGATGTNKFAIHGSATGGGTTNYGVYGTATGATNNWAGYFEGDLKTTEKLYILEGTGTTFHTIFQGGDQGANITYTLPVDDGNSGQVLSTDGSGVLSWATPSGGGSGPTYVYKSANETRTNNTTLSNDADLKFTTTDNTTYGFRIQIVFRDAGTAGDFKYDLVHSNAVTNALTTEFTNAVNATTTVFYKTNVSSTMNILASRAMAGNTANALGSIIIEGTVEIGTGGIVNFRFAQNALSTSGCTVLKGSYLSYWVMP